MIAFTCRHGYPFFNEQVVDASPAWNSDMEEKLCDYDGALRNSIFLYFRNTGLDGKTVDYSLLRTIIAVVEHIFEDIGLYLAVFT